VQVLWSLFGVILVVLAFGWWSARRVPTLENVRFSGETATDSEVNTEILGELATQFSSRFPGRKFELDCEEFELNIPNENEDVYGLTLRVVYGDEIEVVTGHDIHWHFIREYCHTNTGEEVYPAALLLIAQVLDLVDDILCDKICFYAGEVPSGKSRRYKTGARPPWLNESGKRIEEWSWSGWLHI
jgi:hypothetical protein